MAVWETSSDPSDSTQVKLPNVDKFPQDDLPADGTHAKATNKGDAPRPFVTYKDARIYGNDGSRELFFIGFQENGWPAGSVGMKVAKPGGNALTDALSELLFYWDFSTGTQYFNDPTTSKNYMQNGILPDGSGGFAIARYNQDVGDAY
jgi:hypothetical protein